jgi:hypothetical protein
MTNVVCKKIAILLRVSYKIFSNLVRYYYNRGVAMGILLVVS